KNIKSFDIKYRLLILTDNKKSARALPKDVSDWSSNVPKSLERIERDLEKLIPRIETAGGRLSFEVRKYTDTPILHGWCLREPAFTYHFAFCRWNGENYDWGGEKYIKIDQNNSDELSRDLMSIFYSYFEHAWSNATVLPNLCKSV